MYFKKHEGETLAGRLYGVGVGPGDPELITLKALRIIKECGVVAVPGREPQKSIAYNIVLKIYPELDKKELVGIHMPMTKDKAVLEESHANGAGILCRILDAGKDIAFLTLGDVTVYSTYMYLHKKVSEQGYNAEIVNGIPSFCAAAARLGTSLAEKDEELHIIPASYQTEDALKLSGTKVLMKAGKKIADVKESLIKSGLQAVMVENCGMEDERIYRSAENIPENAGYYSLIIVKER